MVHSHPETQERIYAAIGSGRCRYCRGLGVLWPWEQRGWPPAEQTKCARSQKGVSLGKERMKKLPLIE